MPYPLWVVLLGLLTATPTASTAATVHAHLAHVRSRRRRIRAVYPPPPSLIRVHPLHLWPLVRTRRRSHRWEPDGHGWGAGRLNRRRRIRAVYPPLRSRKSECGRRKWNVHPPGWKLPTRESQLHSRVGVVHPRNWLFQPRV